MQRGRATGVVDTSVNKVYVKLNWTKTTIKLNPLPGCFITYAACVRGGVWVLERVLEGFEGAYLFTPFPAFLTKIYSFNFLFASTLLKKSFCFLPISSVLCFSHGRGRFQSEGAERTCLLCLAAQHYKGPLTSNF
jgi:hypothetical protein